MDALLLRERHSIERLQKEQVVNTLFSIHLIIYSYQRLSSNTAILHTLVHYSQCVYPHFSI